MLLVVFISRTWTVHKMQSNGAKTLQVRYIMQSCIAHVAFISPMHRTPSCMHFLHDVALFDWTMHARCIVQKHSTSSDLKPPVLKIEKCLKSLVWWMSVTWFRKNDSSRHLNSWHLFETIRAELFQNFFQNRKFQLPKSCRWFYWYNFWRVLDPDKSKHQPDFFYILSWNCDILVKKKHHCDVLDSSAKI